jgi:hypothetical protein
MPRHTENPGARERSALRKEQALAIRARGVSIRGVARQIGVSVTQAHRYIKAALAEVAARGQAHAEEARALDLARIDRGLLGLADAYERGDPKAAMATARLIELRARLIGTLAPAKVQHSGDADNPVLIADLTATDRVERLRALVVAARARQTPPLLTYTPPNGHVHDGAGGTNDT